MERIAEPECPRELYAFLVSVDAPLKIRDDDYILDVATVLMAHCSCVHGDAGCQYVVVSRLAQLTMTST